MFFGQAQRGARRALVLVSILAALAGCAGSGGGGGSTPNPSPYAGSYTGSGTVDGGKQAALAMTVAEDGKAEGTLTVTAPATAAPATQDYQFSVGVFNVSGTVDDDGNFHLTGTVPGAGDFEMNGELSADGGTYTITAGGETWGGSVSVSAGGGDGQITFSNASGTNANTGTFTSEVVVVSNVMDNLAIVSASGNGTAGQRAFLAAVAADVAIGESVTLNGAAGRVALFYEEGTNGDKKWMATSGTVKLVKRNGSSVRIEVNGAGMQPSMETGNTATGTFTVNGAIEK